MGIKVIGAGMAGLLASAMLRKDCEAVYEAASELPNNHSAVLRFRSSVVADTLNIPFKEVKAIKTTEAWRNPVADAMAYSRKTNGTATLRSVLTASGEPQTRYIAPTDLITRMAAMVEAPIGFDLPFNQERRDSGLGPWISTMPMPSLMKLLGWEPRSEFRWRSGNNVLVDLEGVDAYCSLYVPDPVFPAARISITGDQMIAECYGGWTPGCMAEEFATKCAEKVGLHPSQVGRVEVKKQTYAKILPIDEQERRAFIMWASQEFGIYSLGRFATWRPSLLMDDVVNDVRVIQRLINNRGESYPHQIKE